MGDVRADGVHGGEVRLEGVGHRFPKSVALDRVDVTIEAGEFLGVLGPSGCGKSTLLRILGGFVRPSAGRVLLDGEDITRVPPERRPVNMVFQRPTLFPHLDVFENVAFGLRIAREARGEITRRVGEALALVRLEQLARRRAYELSGGQMQRVALARALVRQPRVLLLDEPLSALDLKIRLEMEVELRRLHAETGATFVYVTHDQREALALSDRIAVFSDGRVEQVGTPADVYRAPRSAYVARFVGHANVLPVEVRQAPSGSRARVSVAAKEIDVPAGPEISAGPAELVLRAEHIELRQGGQLEGRVIDRAFRGTRSSYLLEVPGLDQPLRAEVPAVARSGAEPEIDSTVGIAWDPEQGHLLQASPAAAGPAPAA